VLETAQDHARRTLAEGLANGETVKDLTKRIGQFVEQGRESYAPAVARTEVGCAMNTASADAFGQAGADGLEWIAIVDGRNGDRAHDEMDGVTRAMDEEFTLPSGDTCGFPMDEGLDVGDVVNCRCTTGAWFRSDETEPA